MKKRKRLQVGLPATPSQASPLAKQSEAARASGLRGGRGQTLLEILLAFSVLILVLSAIIIGVTTSLNNTQYTKNQNLANSYAQEGMAVLRQIRDSSRFNYLEDSYTANAVYCLGQKPMELKELTLPNLNCWAQSPVGGIFSREVKFEHDSSGCSEGIPPTPTPPPPTILKGSKVTVTVSWFDSKCPSGDNIYCHNVELISCFSNLDQKQTP